MLSAVCLTACDTTASGKPTVVVDWPPSGSQYKQGDDIPVQSISSDSTGIGRVELAIDGPVVSTYTVTMAATTVPVEQGWTAAPGNHTVVVRAYNTAGMASDPVGITVVVNSGTAAVTPAPGASNAIVVTSDLTTVPPSVSPLGNNIAKAVCPSGSQVSGGGFSFPDLGL
jgi:hypothetical protein